METETLDTELSLIGPGGDTRLSFTKDQIRVTWTQVTSRERKMVKKLLATAEKENFSVATVDADGKPDKPARRKDLPGLFGTKNGEVLLQGSTKNIKVLARQLVEAEIEDGHVVMKARDDGSWEMLRKGEYTAMKEREDRELVEAAAKGEKKSAKKEVLQASEVPAGG
jgi:hypothetical protein